MHALPSTAQNGITAARLRLAVNWRRMALLVATGVPLAIAVWELPLIYSLINTSDYEWYRNAARHWLDTGQWYLPEQLAGSYAFGLNVHVMYPPPALYLFTPFALGLPQVIWWAVPLGLIGYGIWRWRPAMWSWPLLALGVMWHRTLIDTIQGNTNLWIAGTIAAALLWGWPAIFLVLKPTFLAFAVTGTRHQSFWRAGLLFAIANVPLLWLWRDYITAMQNVRIDPTYLPASLPLLLIPVVAWVARQAPRTAAVSPMPSMALKGVNFQSSAIVRSRDLLGMAIRRG